MNFHFFAYAALGKGLSGGDRIFIELSRRWSKKYPVKIYLWKEGFEICKTQGLTKSNVDFEVSSMEPWWRMGFVINYFARIILGIYKGLFTSLDNNPSNIIYSASEFWMDSFPCFFLKLRYPKIKWVASWYQTAPNPLKGFSESNRKEKYYLAAFLYWLVQQPAKFLISKFADFIIVNNEDEKKLFPQMDKNKKVIVCLGAVDLEKVKKFKSKNPTNKKIYDGVFQGRFHPQKGVLELIEIWKKVTTKKPNAKLIMIGDGPLMENAKRIIKTLKLENNVKLEGYLFDGDKKFQIFSQSKIVLHPAFFDSGGMAAAEAMAFGLPGVSFDLPSLKSYYPKGMLKSKNGNLDDFSKNILKLLENKSLYSNLKKQALDIIKASWSWDKRAAQILTAINSDRK